MLSIKALRSELNLSQAAFAHRIGVSGRGQMSEIERGLEGCSPAVALKLEALSAGRIDAAALNDTVAAARAQDFRTHGAASAIDDDADDVLVEARTVICVTCDRRTDDPVARGCTFVDCPHAERQAA